MHFYRVLEFNVEIGKVFRKGHKDLNRSLTCFDVTDKRQNKMDIFPNFVAFSRYLQFAIGFLSIENEKEMECYTMLCKSQFCLYRAEQKRERRSKAKPPKERKKARKRKFS